MRTSLLVLALLTIPFAAWSQDRSAESWLSAAGADPVTYVAAALDRHPVVLLGEGHWIRHDVELVAELVRHHGGTGFQVLASEFYPASMQDRVDSVVFGDIWDRPRAIAILRRDGWPYEEYLDVLQAAWEANGEGRPVRVLALNPGSDWRETILPRGEDYDGFMARLILEAAPRDTVRILGHMGFHHAFTRYHQPDSWRDERVLRFMDRTGNVLRRALGERVFMIALHPPFLCREGERFSTCTPVEGAIDCAAAASGRPVGFDVSGSPFARLPVRAHYRTGYPGLVLGDLADGWVWQRTPDRYESVHLVPLDEYAPGPAELAEALAHNPFTDEDDVGPEGLRALWQEYEDSRTGFAVRRRWEDAAAWHDGCPDEQGN